MGCDIHAHFEIKINGKWEHYSHPDVDRNYPMFAKMAGVRGDKADALHNPTGLPDDVSATVKFESDRWGMDGHNHTCLDALDIAIIEETFSNRTSLRSPFGYFCGNSWSEWLRCPEDRPEGIEDIRLICWFDN